MRKEECYLLGKITRRHGLSGNVLFQLDTDSPQDYNKLESVLVEINGLLVPIFIEKQSWSKTDTKIISIRNANEALINQLIGKHCFLPLASLPKLSGKQFYYHEVIGFNILDSVGKEYGVIVFVNDFSPQHYFTLDYNGKQIVVPVVKDWIIEVDREEKILKMELPEGLLEVFTE